MSSAAPPNERRFVALTIADAVGSVVCFAAVIGLLVLGARNAAEAVARYGHNVDCGRIVIVDIAGVMSCASGVVYG